MNRMLALCALTLCAAVAQGAPPARPQPGTVTLDGRPLRALTYQGQHYVNIDDLRAAGLNGTTQALYLFTSPSPATPAYKTSGCVGELLYNGAAYLRAKPLVPDNITDQTIWRIDFDFQPRLAGLDQVYAKNVQVTMSNGDRLTPGQTIFGTVTPSFVLLQPGQVQTQEVTVGDRAAVTHNPSDRPVRLVVTAVRVQGMSYPAFSIDLSCQVP